MKFRTKLLGAAVALGAALGCLPAFSRTPPATPPPDAAEDTVQEGESDATENPAAGGDKVAPTTPYESIVTRNAFGLKDPPPPPPPAPAKPPEPPVNTGALKLTGLTTLLGKRAMFVFNDGKTNIVSDLVREGERDRFITNLEVLEIDAQARTVKVLFGGEELRLDFVNHGLRPPTNAPLPGATQLAAARPGLPGSLPPPIPRPPSTAAHLGAAAINQAGNTTFTATPPNVTPAGAVRNLPLRPTRFGQPTANAPGASAENAPAVPVEVQLQNMLEQHRVARELNIELPPIPPAPDLGVPGNLAPPALPGMGPPQLPGLPGTP